MERNSTSPNDIASLKSNNQYLQKLVKVVEAMGGKTKVPTPTFIDKDHQMEKIKRSTYFNQPILFTIPTIKTDENNSEITANEVAAPSLPPMKSTRNQNERSGGGFSRINKATKEDSITRLIEEAQNIS